jgi:pyruvate/2-oxoglutarate dehydrogenase complex dihydrolipoamide dehydrogenase (E3) component
MPELLKPEICVIGGGSGGLSVAAAAAAFGVEVVLVEKDRMGGDCLNYGCVPSKALLAAAKRAQALRTAASFGLIPVPPAVDFPGVRAHIRDAIDAIAPNDSRERFAGLGVRVIAGTARFTDANTVGVGADIEIRARRTVVAAGSSPLLPPIAGLTDVPYLTNETVFDLTECPRHLVVIGAGPVGLELAQAFRRLGARVTVLDAANPLAADDPECAAVVLDQLVREGVVIRSGVTVTRLERGSNVRVRIEAAGASDIVEGSHLLIAAGRRPNLDDLNLKAAGIGYDPGGIKVNRRLKTTNPKVYAIGDVVGGAFTHLASHHAGLVVRNALFRLPVDVSSAPIPAVTYTDPELARVGMSEAQARGRHRTIRILRWPYHDNDRAVTEHQTPGHIKVVTSSSGRILGASIVGAHAGELITTWTLAIARQLKVGAFADLVVPYPTLGEIGRRAAMSYFTPGLTNPWVQRIIGLLRQLP